MSDPNSDTDAETKLSQYEIIDNYLNNKDGKDKFNPNLLKNLSYTNDGILTLTLAEYLDPDSNFEKVFKILEIINFILPSPLPDTDPWVGPFLDSLWFYLESLYRHDELVKAIDFTLDNLTSKFNKFKNYELFVNTVFFLYEKCFEICQNTQEIGKEKFLLDVEQLSIKTFEKTIELYIENDVESDQTNSHPSFLFNKMIESQKSRPGYDDAETTRKFFKIDKIFKLYQRIYFIKPEIISIINRQEFGQWCRGSDPNVYSNHEKLFSNINFLTNLYEANDNDNTIQIGDYLIIELIIKPMNKLDTIKVDKIKHRNDYLLNLKYLLYCHFIPHQGGLLFSNETLTFQDKLKTKNSIETYLDHVTLAVIEHSVLLCADRLKYDNLYREDNAIYEPYYASNAVILAVDSSRRLFKRWWEINTCSKTTKTTRKQSSDANAFNQKLLKFTNSIIDMLDTTINSKTIENNTPRELLTISDLSSNYNLISSVLSFLMSAISVHGLKSLLDMAVKSGQKSKLKTKLKNFIKFIKDSAKLAESSVSSNLDKIGGVEAFSDKNLKNLSKSEKQELFTKCEKLIPCPVELEKCENFWPNFLNRLGMLEMNMRFLEV